MTTESGSQRANGARTSMGAEHSVRISAGRRRVAMIRGGKMDAAPPWMAEIMIIDQQYDDARDDVARLRARRSLSVFLAYRYFGASQRWLGEKLKMKQPDVNKLIREGELVCAKAKHGDDLETMVEIVYGPRFVSMGWDGAR